VADAVAASMAVPVVFAPIVIRTYPEKCKPLPPFLTAFRGRPEGLRQMNSIARALAAYRDPRTRYVKVADGGLTDNFGVSTLTMSRLIYGTPYAPMTERDAVRIRRLLVIVVDASQGPHGEWTHHPEGPGGLDLALSATDAAIDAAARYAADAFGVMVEDWQASVIKYRCGLAAAELKRLGAPARWDCRDVNFTVAHLAVDELASPVRERIDAVPTRLTLEAAQVDASIDGARDGLLALPGLQGYLRERVTPTR
jgi:NTE family protein